MDPKFIANTNATETLFTLTTDVKAAKETFHSTMHGLQAKADQASAEYEQKHLEGWEKIKEQLHADKLITDEEKAHGQFMITDHNQILLERISRPRPGLTAVNAAADTADNTGNGGQAEAPEAGV